MREQDIRQIVVDTVSAVLAVDRDSFGDSLTGLPTFDSFRMIEIVERLERRLAVELDAADLTPANLTRVGRLCDLFGRSRRETAC